MSSKLRFFGLGKLRPFLKPYLLQFIWMAGCAIMVGVFSMILPLFQKYAIDTFIAGQTLTGFVWFLVAYFVCALLLAAVDFAACFTCGRLEMYVLRDMRRVSFNHLQTLSVAYYSVNGVGRIHARVMSDTSAVSSVVSWTFYQGVWNAAYAIGAVIVMFILNPILALVAIAVVPVVGLVSMWFSRRLTGVNRRVRQLNSEITGAFNEGIAGAETAKTLSAIGELDRSFYEGTHEMKRWATRQGSYRALFSAVISFAAYAALALVLWYGGIATAQDLRLLGTLSVFMTYAQGVMGLVQWSVEAISDLIAVKVNIERFCDLMGTESDVKDTPEVVARYGDSFHEKRENWEKLEGHICFEDVTFRYPDGEEYVLEHFNLDVPAGTTVALVGETGAGKSTLVNLVCRFYEPTEGRLLIDGKDARLRSVQWLHSNIGYVLQTPHLFSGTVRENLAFGKEDATDTELYEALKKANAEGIVRRLGGLDAPLGEDGSTLSAGEKQLLSLARAILRDPAIFILDEATSSVDSETELAVQSAIERLMEGRTSFIVAHRLSTIRSADVILVVEDGKIVERGTHRELFEKHGVYRNLYEKQFREEQVDKF